MSALKICPTCGAEYPANERFCPRDGAALRTQGGGTDLVGSIIAERYHVIRKLGEGGMGQVYLAEHVKMGRKSAVKVMNPGMVHDADAISRFNREAANASRINHPNVAGIYDFGETPDGLIFLAMEYIEGQPLTELVESTGALPPMRAADIARQAADALTVAHEMGIVHRDLKPDNIMIAKNRDGSDCVKVVDFGIAKAADNQAQKVTRTGLVVGTPEYMSPEQLAGDKLDGRSDVYSLALVAFHMLTGRLPFPSDTAQESMIMRLTDKPRSLAEMQPGSTWSPEVQAVMDRALERDAKLRYQTANEFGRALYAALAMMDPDGAEARTSVMDAVPPTRVGEPAAPPVKRKRRGPILIGVGLMALVAAGLAYMQQNGNAERVATPIQPLAAAVRPDSSAAWEPESALKAGQVTAAGASQPSSTLAGSAANKRDNSPPATAPPDMASRVAALVTRSEDSLAAHQVLEDVRTLQARASSNADRAGLGLARAQALAFLRKDDEACTALRSVRRMSLGTRYQSGIDRLLKYSSC
ncbi:MAG: protein kinase domain-containing protein [Gemmatimonadaceae bacterium]